MAAKIPFKKPTPFKAETRQLLNILIHSLYSEREVFLRELISNASDALTRLDFEMLTNRDVLEPDAEPGIWISVNKDERLLTIRDNGIGMTAEEMAENLGTIAHSGARAFLEAANQEKGAVSNLIGQFGVGFYAAFMVAEWIEVTSRSYQKESQAAVWYSEGEETFTIRASEELARGTTIKIKLKEDAADFTEEYRIREIVKRHSDFVPYPIYLGENADQVNQVTAIWRKSPREVTEEQVHDFYRQFTLDFTAPVAYAHMNVDAPVQLYAMLFIPENTEKSFFSLRKEDGIKLYARKVLIQEYCRDLLPEYFRFVQGVVDSEDIPLNVNRETMQASRIIPQLKRLITNRVIDLLKDLAQNKKETYEKFWKASGRFVKEGIASDRENLSNLSPLLRFSSLNHPGELRSLDDYIAEMKPSQNKIYYLTGEDERSLMRSPHLDLYRKQGFDVLLLSDPIDAFVVLALQQYKDHPLAGATAEKPEGGETTPDEPQITQSPEKIDALITLFKDLLGDKVVDVRSTDRLTDSPARLVNKDGSTQPEMQRVYRLLQKEFDEPEKVLEINPDHQLITGLLDLTAEDPRRALIVEQIYENALLIEGLHPNPATMIERIQQMMQAMLK
ncbi:MAG: molecular chaperone HtpG [Anaerolineae bacterium]|nr:molecular chaperone HtpG [Anaerolineae bacterium]